MKTALCKSIRKTQSAFDPPCNTDWVAVASFVSITVIPNTLLKQ